MKITRIYSYPIKALPPISVARAEIDAQGIKYDRRFMLVKVEADGGLTNVQIFKFPECTRLFQEIDGDDIVVTYHPPEGEEEKEAVVHDNAREDKVRPPPLRVPLRPETTEGWETIDITIMDSKATAYRMGPTYDAWFTSCLGYETLLVYLGDGRRPVLAHAPQHGQQQQQRQRKPAQGGWYSSITSYITGSSNDSNVSIDREGKMHSDAQAHENWLSFNEAAPLLIATEASLADVSARLPAGEPMDMRRFRPNIVVDGIEPWDEDFWAELSLPGGGDESSSSSTTNINDGSKPDRDQQRRRRRLALTANCARCLSINIDYEKGKPASGDAGTVLKKLMRDRRVDSGTKWSPIFGRYAFLLPPARVLQAATQSGTDGVTNGSEIENEVEVQVAVGDEAEVTRRNQERSVWSWPAAGSNSGTA